MAAVYTASLVCVYIYVYIIALEVHFIYDLNKCARSVAFLQHRYVLQYRLKHTYLSLSFTVSVLYLTLILLTWTIWRAPTNASKWRMGFNSAFKGLNISTLISNTYT